MHKAASIRRPCYTFLMTARVSVLLSGGAAYKPKSISMKKVFHVIAKVVLSLIILLPIVGTTGLLGEATRDLYNTDIAFSFIEMLVSVMYVNYLMAAVLIVALIALWTKREALAAILIMPISLNVVAFHLFLDGGLLTGGALMGNVMLLLNVYLLWKNRDSYRTLLAPASR